MLRSWCPTWGDDRKKESMLRRSLRVVRELDEIRQWTMPSCRLRRAAWTVWLQHHLECRQRLRAGADTQDNAALSRELSRSSELDASSDGELFSPRQVTNPVLAAHLLMLHRAIWCAWRDLTVVAMQSLVQSCRYLQNCQSARGQDRAWKSWRRAFHLDRRLRTSAQAVMANVARRRAMWAVRQLNRYAKFQSTAETWLQAARSHLWRRRTRAGVRQLGSVVARKRQLLHAAALAAANKMKALQRKSILAWRISPDHTRRADVFLVSATFRRWLWRVHSARFARETALRDAMDSLKWRRAFTCMSWREWKKRAATAAEVRPRLNAAADAFADKRHRSILWDSLVAWRGWAQALGRARWCWTSKCARLLTATIQAWQGLFARRRSARSRLGVASGTRNARVRRVTLQQWRRVANAKAFCHCVVTRERFDLLARAVRAFRTYRTRKQLQEQNRRKANLWRQLKIFKRGFSAFLRAVSQRAAADVLVAKTAAIQGACLVARSFNGWCLLAQPQAKIHARRHWEFCLRRSAFNLIRWYTQLRHAAQIARVEVRAEILRITLRAAWARLRTQICARTHHRQLRREQSFELQVKLGTAASFEAIRLWRQCTVAQQQGKRLLKLAHGHRVMSLLNIVWAVLLHQLQYRRASIGRLAGHLHRTLRKQTSRFLQEWREATIEYKRAKGHRDEALLQWYSVLSASAFRLWRVWCTARRQKLERQERARRMFAQAQRAAAVRALLWRFDSRCTSDEAWAAESAAEAQRHRVERACATAVKWRAAARQGVSVNAATVVPSAATAAGMASVQTPRKSCGRRESISREPAQEMHALSGNTDAGAQKCQDAHAVHAAWSASATSAVRGRIFGECTATTMTAGILSSLSPEPLRDSWTPSLSESWPSPIHNLADLPEFTSV